jgi:hypothetical protein
MAAGSFILPLLPDIIDFEVNNAVEGQVNNTAPTGVVLLDTDLNQINPVSITQIANYFEIVIATGSIVPAIIEINGGAFKTVDPGDTLDILIENSDLVSVGTPDAPNNRVDIADSTLLIQKSDSTLIFSFDIAAEDLEFYNVADSAITVLNSLSNVVDSGNVKATENGNFTAPDGTYENSDSTFTDSVASGELNKLIPDIDLSVNSIVEGSVPSVKDIDIELEDSLSNPITPSSVTMVGDVLTIEVPSGGGSPSGVLFKTIEPGQYTSYRTGDEGWRVQNNWYDYTPPINPKAIAELGYTSVNFFNVLKSPLIVNGISSTVRFVDINGVQAFTTTGNANLVVIDKLTGMMYSRGTIAAGGWNAAIDGAIAYSITVNSNVYDDWYLISRKEIVSIIHYFAGIDARNDTITNILLWQGQNNCWTSTTNPANTANAYRFITGTRNIDNFIKTETSIFPLYVTNARNLITAP